MTQKAPFPQVERAIRYEVENFLCYEAALLDEWRLNEWLDLFSEDARYLVPTTDLPEGDPQKQGDQIVFIDDDIVRLRGRVARLKSRHAHREHPWSRTRRLITNVRITAVTAGDISATAAFLVYRVRMGQVTAFVGHCEYRLRRVGGMLKIHLRRAVLDLESLYDAAAVSMIL